MKFVIDDDTTLLDLLDLNLHKFEEEVKTIVDKSVKEMAMEKSLKEFSNNWMTAEFEYELHPRTGCKLLKVAEEIMEILEDNQVSNSIFHLLFISVFLFALVLGQVVL